MMNLGAELVKLLFVFSLGACIGSLTNVLVYRMPLGLSVVTPSSRCPKCETKLRWNDNIPVLGWLFLRGRCRYCKVRISPEYPIVELIGGLLFALPFFLFYTILDLPASWGTEWLGVDWATLAPEWSRNPIGVARSWPIFLVMLTLLGCLLPATIIDARTFMIPLILTWIPAVTAVLVLPATAYWHQTLMASGRRAFAFADGWTWAIASPGPAGWQWVGGAIGATIGLGASLIAMKAGLLKQSFADYDEWEKKALAEEETAEGPKSASEQGKSDSSNDDEASNESAVSGTSDGETDTSDEGDNATESSGEVQEAGEADLGEEWVPGRWIATVAIVLVCAVVGGIIARMLGTIQFGGVAAGFLVGPLVAGVVERLRTKGATEQEEASPATMWLAYPHARRETIRELAFLGMPALLGLGGWMLATRLAGPWTTDPTTFQQVPAHAVPLWLDVLGGVLVGYLVGGGVVWAVRILGTLSFGKEAMGLGDVHLMAGVGACLGWVDPTLAFFLAAFVAIYMTIVALVWAGEGRRAMPFGPALVVATLLIYGGKTGVEAGINAWLGRTPQNHNMIDLP